ncbi:MAG: hypothetical protein RLP14_05940 [Owenweeksia sp.]
MARQTTRNKRKTRRKKKVKQASCRTAGHQMNSQKKVLRKAGAKKLGGRGCKTKDDIKRSTSKLKKISRKAKQIRVKGESWTNAMRRAAKQV